MVGSDGRWWAGGLERALDRLRLRGAADCRFEGLDTQGLRPPAAPEARFHAVRERKCWPRVGDESPIHIESGEPILLSRENPLHHYHITVFDTPEALERLKASDAIKRFTERLYPHIDHSTFVSPLCDVWLADGKGVADVH